MEQRWMWDSALAFGNNLQSYKLKDTLFIDHFTSDKGKDSCKNEELWKTSDHLNIHDNGLVM